MIKVEPNFETNTICFGELKKSEYFPVVKRDLRKFVIWVLNPKDCEHLKTNKEFFQFFTKKVGCTPSKTLKVWNQINWLMFIKPIEPFVKKIGMKGGKHPKINVETARLLFEKREIIFRAHKDKIDNIIPILLITKANPKVSKEYLGKGLWKSLCKNSFTRNLYIYHYIINHAPLAKEHLPFIKKLLYKSNLVPSSFLHTQNVNVINCTEQVIAYICKISKQRKIVSKPTEVRCLLDVFLDTQRMANQLQEPFNYDWTFEKLHQKHQEFITKINQRRSVENIFDENDLPTFAIKELDDQNCIAKLITNSSELSLEGKIMHHCVASYGRKIKAGHCIVYTIQNKKDPKKRSTASFSIYKRPDNEILRLDLEQHYSYSNSQPDDELKSIVHTLKQELNQKLLQTSLKENPNASLV